MRVPFLASPCREDHWAGQTVLRLICQQVFWQRGPSRRVPRLYS